MSFDSRQPGRRVDEWARVLADAPAVDLDLSRVSRAIVVGAHPDDETLGAGGLIRRLDGLGVPVLVVCATDGGGSHPDLDPAARSELIAVRRAELASALARLAPTATMRMLEIPDGECREHRAQIEVALDAEVAAAGAGVLLVAPWSGDGHRDHRVVGEVGSRIADRRRIPLLAYPIWFWHWGDPAADLGTWEQLRTLRLADDERRAKSEAIARHSSQLLPVQSEPPVLRADFVEHFRGEHEAFVLASGADTLARHFDRMHLASDDPWDTGASWYERRKRELMLAALPREHYSAVLEIGSSTGETSSRLAARCDRLTAVDLAPSATDATRRALPSVAHAVAETWDVRRALPEGRFDLIVLSEVGYYLDSDELRGLIERLRPALAEDGHLVACHWRGRADDMPQSGADVQRALAAAFDTAVLIDDPEFEARVLVSRGAA